MKFSELKIGQEFGTDIDLDEYTPSFYKVSETEAYQTAGISSGTRETFDPDTEIYPDEVIRKLHDQPTEIEFAAVLMLKHADISHPGLMMWVQALTADPNEMRSLNTYIQSDPQLVEDLVAEGFVREERVGWIGPILDHKPKGYRPDDPKENLDVQLDRAAAILGFALQQYRTAGRPENGWSATIWGSGPLLRTDESLAKAVAQFYLTTPNALRRYANQVRQGGIQ